MDDTLRRALEPVLRDIRASGAPRPTITDSGWADDPLTASAMLTSRDGTGAGIVVMLADGEVERVMRVAEQVQEWVIEDLWSNGAPTNWPVCPHHRGTHPLAAAIRVGTVVWVCPSDGTAFSAVGGLA